MIVNHDNIKERKTIKMYDCDHDNIKERKTIQNV